MNLNEKKIECAFVNFPTILTIYREFKNYLSILSFLFDRKTNISFGQKILMVKKILIATYQIDCPHNNYEILSYIRDLFLNGRVEGSIVEAGCYKGGSTVKFSYAAEILNKDLIIFDSFKGIPKHEEPHKNNLYGKPVSFAEGEYCGRLDEVKENVTQYGQVNVCTFIKGWFSQTIPTFKESLSAVYIDADLAASVKICIKYLYPQLRQGGVLYCQDGHLPLVIEVFDDNNFWLKEVGCPKPHVEGLGQNKILRIVKP